MRTFDVRLKQSPNDRKLHILGVRVEYANEARLHTYIQEGILLPNEDITKVYKKGVTHTIELPLTIHIERGHSGFLSPTQELLDIVKTISHTTVVRMGTVVVPTLTFSLKEDGALPQFPLLLSLFPHAPN